MTTGEKEIPKGSKFKVIDIIERHKSREIKFEGGPVEFPGRVQLKLVDTEKRDPFKGGKANRPFNCVEEKRNEQFPFRPVNKT